MVPLKFKIAMGQLLLLVAQLQVFFVRQEMEITTLTKEVQEYKEKLSQEERRSEQLDSTVQSLKRVVEENNERVQFAAQAQESLKAQGKLQQAQADAQAKTYEEKIKALMAKNQEGTVCEQVFGLLDSLD